MPVPRVIHQMWLDPERPDCQTPPDRHPVYRDFIRQLQAVNPNFEYRWWNLEAVEALFQQPELRKFAATFEAIPRIIMKCDFSRYAVMYLYGGYYFDLDTYFHRSLPTEWESEDLLLFQEPGHLSGGKWPEMEEQTGYSSSVANNVLISRARNPFWLQVLEESMLRLQQVGPVVGMSEVIHVTGPNLITEMVIRHRLYHRVKSACYFFGVDMQGQNRKCLKRSGCHQGYICRAEEVSLAVATNDWREGSSWQMEDISLYFWRDLFIVALLTILVLALVLIILSHGGSGGQVSWPQFPDPHRLDTT